MDTSYYSEIKNRIKKVLLDVPTDLTFSTFIDFKYEVSEPRSKMRKENAHLIGTANIEQAYKLLTDTCSDNPSFFNNFKYTSEDSIKFEQAVALLFEQILQELCDTREIRIKPKIMRQSIKLI